MKLRRLGKNRAWLRVAGLFARRGWLMIALIMVIPPAHADRTHVSAQPVTPAVIAPFGSSTSPDGQCPGDAGGAGYDHCSLSSSACPFSAIAVTPVPITEVKANSPLGVADAVRLGLLIAPDSHPPKFISHI